MHRPRTDDAILDDFRRYVCQTSAAPMGIVVARASGSTIWDVSGRPYLDFLAGMGVANVGHANPDVVVAVREQSERYLHVMVYGEMALGPQVALARRLAAAAPEGLEVTYFTNSGAEAIEGALKTARKFTGRPHFVAFEGSFHGDTCGALSVGGNPMYRAPFEPLLNGVAFLPFGDVAALQRIDERVAAVVVELVQSEGGVRIATGEFLAALRARCTAVGALLIVDEVVTAFGRTGRLFACDHWGVAPDLLVLAKALGGGMPLGAFIGRREVMATLQVDPPLAHVTTFGGHPVSCAAGTAAFDYLERHRLAARATVLGDRLRDGLRDLRGTAVRDVRGLGALVGLEFHDPAVTQRFVQRCLNHGLILGWTLHRDTVVRLAPPLVLTDDELERGLAIMRAALG